jgi:hypothetical protein
MLNLFRKGLKVNLPAQKSGFDLKAVLLEV